MAHKKDKPTPINPDSLTQGYEVGEMQFRIVLIFGLIISAATVVSMVLMVFFFRALTAYAPTTSRYEPSPMAMETTEFTPVPTAPVEAEPVVDRLALEVPAREALDEYGWVSQEAGIARIPIAEAMAMIVEHGELPRLVPIEAVIPVGPDAAPADEPEPYRAPEGSGAPDLIVETVPTADALAPVPGEE